MTLASLGYSRWELSQAPRNQVVLEANRVGVVGLLAETPDASCQGTEQWTRFVVAASAASSPPRSAQSNRKFAKDIELGGCPAIQRAASRDDRPDCLALPGDGETWWGWDGCGLQGRRHLSKAL